PLRVKRVSAFFVRGDRIGLAAGATLGRGGRFILGGGRFFGRDRPRQKARQSGGVIGRLSRIVLGRRTRTSGSARRAGRTLDRGFFNHGRRLGALNWLVLARRRIFARGGSVAFAFIVLEAAVALLTPALPALPARFAATALRAFGVGAVVRSLAVPVTVAIALTVGVGLAVRAPGL